jgi:DNA helicase II / ATP-dependent DNA helicase PcrA
MTQAARQGLSRRLAAAINELDEKQRQAVIHTGSTVVTAGPGSGKTKTLVTKVGVLLQADVSPNQGVACITFTNQAANEVSRRLARLGVHEGSRLSCGTVHSWCLNEILRKYRALHGVPLADPMKICSDKTAGDIAERCLLDAGANFYKVEFEMTTLTKIRRALAAGEGVAGFEDEKVVAAAAFEQALIDQGLIDYEAMVGRALQALQQKSELAEIIAARYPWLVVDEYQDLGPVLHRIVVRLRELAGVEVFCVGDADQSVMGFSGADPRYLVELEGRTDFLPVQLVRNYRSGSAILAAAELALGETRNYETARDTDENGLVEGVAVEGGLDDHARAAVENVQASLAAGVPPHEIAVLYPRRGPLLDELVSALEASGIDFLHERDEKLPGGPLADFIRSCDARTVAGPRHCGWNGSTVRDAPVLAELARDYHRLLRRTSLSEPTFFETAERMQQAVDGHTGAIYDPAAWLDGLASALSLDALAAASEEQRDAAALEKLREAVNTSGLTVADLAAGVVQGKVVLTTYHSAKGREFDLVILPGLVEGVLPKLDWNRSMRRWEDPARAVLAEARRTFYVALTRAKAGAVLIYGPGYFGAWGHWNGLGPSRFLEGLV